MFSLWGIYLALTHGLRGGAGYADPSPCFAPFSPSNMGPIDTGLGSRV